MAVAMGRAGRLPLRGEHARSVLGSVLRRGFADNAMPEKVIPVSSLSAGGLLSFFKGVVSDKLRSPLPPDYKVDPSLLQAQVPTLVTSLPNGLRVATETSKVGTATVGVWIDAGTRFEKPELNGAAHFLEHLIFKGTSKRTQRALEQEVENLGAHLNAYTSREQTVYYARALKEDVPQVTELLSDILQNSLIAPDAIERERSVILREMQEIDTLPDEVLFDYLHSSAYQGTPLGQTILGPEANIKSLTRESLAAYVSEHYKPHRMVLVGAGDIEHAELVKLAEKHFGSLKADPGARSAAELCAEKPAFLTGSDVKIQNDFMDEAHVAIAYETCGWAHPDAPAFMVLQALLGTWDRTAGTGDVTSNKLAQGMAATSGCMRYMAFNTTYTDTGLWGVYAVAKPEDLDDVAHEIVTTVTNLCFKCDEAALDAAKRMLKTNLVLQLENTSSIAEDIGRQMLVYGRRIPLAEMFARIDAVDAAAVSRIGHKYFYDREMGVASMGAVNAMCDYNYLRRRTYSLWY
ncbi:putative mitochondrial-processing peptidase subunit beta, mitochondrial [Porphyridium purpureum]|uniref:mitochondrial processing peptidase n=1 Tax=Porphyridium purpureum TaxID=35688 RepID=A0A5J4Z332_PORPP|nr:putative mitochondrial-processing peptidase subunit beta, mitochondrial [Porphyridium purpureum]|eukprot:POR7303..scf208_2